MQLLKKRGILIFWGLLLCDCYFILTNNENYRLFTKGLLVPVIVFYIYTNARRNHYQKTKTLLFFALIAAWIGDLALLKNGNTFLIIGMGCFFIFNILIGVIFYRIHKLKLAKCQEAFLAIVIYFVMCYQLYKFINPGLGNLKIPVLIYMAGLGFAIVMISNHLENSARKVNARSLYLPAIALLFLSDAVLALHTFITEFQNIRLLAVVVMLSYGYSMSLFGEGFAKFFKG